MSTHHVTVTPADHDHRKQQAVCTCGWRSAPKWTYAGALRHAADHADYNPPASLETPAGGWENSARRGAGGYA